MADAMKLGDQHTAIMDAIHGDLLRQNPGAFVEEDGNATLVIPTKPFLTIDVSSLAEAVLPLAASPPAREEASTYADDLVNASMRRRDADFGREEAPAKTCKSCNGTRRELGSAFNRCEACREETPAGGSDGLADLEEHEHEDQRELSLLYRHRFDDSLQFNRGNMRMAIRHGRRLALRNRTSEPEAGAVAIDPKDMKAIETWIDAGEPWDMTPRGHIKSLWQSVRRAHPAPATADKLRVAVEALSVAEDELDRVSDEDVTYEPLMTKDALCVVRQALAALNEGGE